MTRFIEKIATEGLYDPKQVLGYSETELLQIERLYEVRFEGDLRQFMLEMGRSDGGLLGDDPIILYRESWSVRTQLLTQVELREELSSLELKDELVQQGLKELGPSEKEFLFSIEAETQYYFLKTATGSDQVFHYDENHETVKETGLSFLEYMKQLVKEYSPQDYTICRGELIVI